MVWIVSSTYLFQPCFKNYDKIVVTISFWPYLRVYCKRGEMLLTFLNSIWSNLVKYYTPPPHSTPFQSFGEYRNHPVHLSVHLSICPSHRCNYSLMYEQILMMMGASFVIWLTVLFWFEVVWVSYIGCFSVIVWDIHVWKVYLTCVLCFRFSSLRFVNLKELQAADLPLLPSEFESLIRKQCWDAHEVLRKK